MLSKDTMPGIFGRGANFDCATVGKFEMHVKIVYDGALRDFFQNSYCYCTRERRAHAIKEKWRLLKKDNTKGVNLEAKTPSNTVPRDDTIMHTG
jgi:hypothetical protein